MSGFPLHVTAIYAGLLGVMLVVISVRVSMVRGKTKIMFHDGGNDTLMRSIRVQGNFIEYVPLALALMAMAEWIGQPGWVLHALGGGLLAGRLIHAAGLYGHSDLGRGTGATLSWIVIFAASLLLLYATLA